MRKKSSSRKPTATKRSRASRLAFILGAMVAVAAGAISLFDWLRSGKTAAENKYVPRPRGQLTFNKDVAPILLQHCSGCHRPGQSAPFALLTYQDARKRAANIADVTTRRFMPPWLPDGDFGEFTGDRRLSANEIGILQQWAGEGAAEGSASDLPPLPQWNSEWQLGQPDLVLTMPQSYSLAAEGRDVYRNFVIPVPVTTTRYVKAVELRPGNMKIVHHAFLKADRSVQSRRLDAEDAEPGFAGMSGPAEVPDGQFLGWQPGRLPVLSPEGLPWRLNPGTDLVLQAHLNPSGKLESLQSSIGLYFTDRPPTNSCLRIALTSYIVDIPAGATNYEVGDDFVLPVDVELLAVLPHAHYLAREMHGWATLPGGARRELLHIKQWDFNWQGDYRYAKPVSLPKGSTLSMRFTYDNSTNNARNPNHPPRPVTYGPQSRDEMAELWFQVMPRRQADLDLLARDYQAKLARLFQEQDEYDLRKNPRDVRAHTDLGSLLFNQNKLEEAETHFRAAVGIQPELVQGHYGLGLVLRKQNRLAEASAEFETVLRLDPKDFKSHGNLGYISLLENNLVAAQTHFEAALRLNPDDAIARAGLEDTLKAAIQPPK